MPGPLAAFANLLGARVDQTHVPAEPISLTGVVGPATAKIWAERIVVEKADVTTLLRYPPSSDWLDNAPAIVTRTVGKGRITYIGAWLDDAALRRTLAWAATKADVHPLLANVPDGVEITARDKAGKRLIVAINWAQLPKTLTLPVAQTDLLTGTRATEFTLAPYGVRVIETP